MMQDNVGVVREGLEILTSDGEKLGTVKAVAPQAFEVNAPLQLDYWLPRSVVVTVGGDRLVMGFTEEQVGLYKMANPDDIAGTAAADLNAPPDRI